MSAVIKVENISKAYRLGEVGTGTLSRDLERWIAKEDPFLTVGETNDRTIKGSSDVVWSLKDISFEVQHGEAVGIIGGNGAGKSTLLKLLSRITSPTSGNIRVKGRIASLLEVGTGFHPELSGRENIFLNGSILGMRKKEIARHFDEIVDFAGVERYVDTPVKRYSSGMYVRLAFAVAAHLDPDIMIVDEVLAVGDADFQKKCMGKMKEVSSEQGRTILFVSHNMQAVTNLCSKAIYLKNGEINAIGETHSIVNQYLGSQNKKLWKRNWQNDEEAPGNRFIKIRSLEMIPHLLNVSDPIDIRTPITVKFKIKIFIKRVNLVVGLHLFTAAGDCIFDVCCNPAWYDEGIIEGACEIPGNFLNDGSYYFSIIFVQDTSKQLLYFEDCLNFEVEDFRENMNWYGKWIGAVRPQFPFQLKQ
jgi:lipopolysaccharide transport system ATP-binding protein